MAASKVIADGECEHYRRQCQLVAPCCGKVYSCRLCHDKFERHTMNRYEVALVQCNECDTVQRVGRRCMACGVTFGAAYFCVVCRLYDDDDQGQYHCAACGLCRKGGKKNFFHCNTCGLCLPTTLKEDHTCILDASQRDCPICDMDLHSSTISCTVPPCGHLLHKNCYEQSISRRHFNCKVCGDDLRR